MSPRRAARGIRPRLLVLCLVASAALAAACRHGPPANTPQAVADRFVEDYFVLTNQREALGLSVAVARDKLETEIRDVDSIRGGAAEAPEEAKQDVAWRRTYFQQGPVDSRAIYEITVKQRQGGQTMKRYTYVTLHDQAGQWKVADYLFSDEPPPGATQAP